MYIVFICCNLYPQRLFNTYCIVLCRILYEQLDGARRHKAGQLILRDIDRHFESFRKTDLKQVYIQPDEYQFVAKRNDFLLFALDHVPVYAGKLVGIDAGRLGFLLADQTVQDVEGVEKEMRVDLPLELQVTVLSHVCLFSLRLHLVPGHQGVVDHIYYAIYGDLKNHGNREHQHELLAVKSYEKRLKEGRKDHESYIEYDGTQLRRRFFTLAYGSDEQDIDADEYDQGEGIRHEFSDHLEYGFLFQRSLVQEQDDEDSYQEYSGCKKEDPFKVWG